MFDWLAAHGGLAFWASGVSIGSLLLAVALLPVVLGGLPVDYFRNPVRRGPKRHPALALTGQILRNVFGFILLLVGIALLLLPGQGLLTMIAGLVLMQFPGKFRLERALAARPGVFKALNWLRARRGKPPFEPPFETSVAPPPGEQR